MSGDAHTFGGWLKWRRRTLGLTQKELARRVGYAAVTLRKVEADELRPSHQMAGKLAAALELAPEEQAQFVRFARDEAHWDDLGLPGRVAAPPIPAAPKPPPVASLPRHGAAAPAAIVSAAPRRLDNLPAQSTPLMGREHELAELAHLLSDPATRLVTILSPGGMGKTHLALAAASKQAERFANGVCWVALAPLADAGEIVLAIAAALGLPLQGERSPAQQVADFLRAKHLLLVLDNFEHLIEGAPLVGELLARAPRLSILVTSRRRLKLTSETVLYLDSLHVPGAGGDALDYPAVQLFLLHARRAGPHMQPDADDLAGIVEVCRLVHGMPLGILLAAAWSGVLTPAEIAREIGRDLDFLQADMQDIPARQASLRAVFLHTWNRLSAAERDAFMRLSVLRGGATRAAAQAVTGASVDVLAGLVDKALLRRLPGGRYELHELLRQFAADQLAGDASLQIQAQLQHSRHYLGLLAAQEERLQGREQRAALDALRADFENVGAAWRWAVEQRQFGLLAPAVDALFLANSVRDSYSEGAILFALAERELAAAVQAGDAALQPLWGRVLVRLGACEVAIYDYARGEPHLEAGLRLAASDGERALALRHQGIAAGEQGKIALAHSLFAESLALGERCDDAAGMAVALRGLNFGDADYAVVHRRGVQSLALARRAGRPDLIARMLNMLGWYTWCVGGYAEADACWQEGLAMCRQLGLQVEEAWAIDCLGVAAWGSGDLAAAERYLEQALAIYADLGLPMGTGMCMAELALVLAGRGQAERAVALARQAVAITREINGQIMLTLSLNYLGAALLAAGELGEARAALVEAVRQAWHHHYPYNLMVAFYFFAELLDTESARAAPPDALARREQAVALLACVRAHSATWQVFRDKAEALQARIEVAFPAGALAAALERAQSQTVADMVNALRSP